MPKQNPPTTAPEATPSPDARCHLCNTPANVNDMSFVDGPLLVEGEFIDSPNSQLSVCPDCTLRFGFGSSATKQDPTSLTEETTTQTTPKDPLEIPDSTNQ